ncbi:hypothetical protein PQR71_14030 [Paraburkholderia fungorum]|uniref:hypothetical protein n=1 Tax=Paraburkholderia fungorum TaxID=134537 RepID=UPI0038B8DE4A
MSGLLRGAQRCQCVAYAAVAGAACAWLALPGCAAAIGAAVDIGQSRVLCGLLALRLLRLLELESVHLICEGLACELIHSKLPLILEVGGLLGSVPYLLG